MAANSDASRLRTENQIPLLARGLHSFDAEVRGLPEIRERALLSGLGDLGDAELLTLLLGTGGKQQSVEHVAVALLEAAGGVEGIARFGPHALSLLYGIGPAKATRVAAGIELGRRALLRSISEQRHLVDCFEAAADWAMPRLAGLDHEEVWLLCLDGRSGLKSATRVAQGGLHGCALTARDVLGPAVRHGASAILLIHNHPSGDPSPSPDDVEMTRHVARCAELVGIPLLDHVVVARSGAKSVLGDS